MYPGAVIRLSGVRLSLGGGHSGLSPFAIPSWNWATAH